MSTQAAFLEQRRRYIGGTDIGAIIGVSPWSSPLSVYMDKIGEGIDQAETLAMRRGRWAERFIAREFVRERPEYVVDLHPEPVVRDDWGFPAGASLDGLVRMRRARAIVGVFEAKTTSAWNARSFDAWTGEMPDAYFVQVQWYMAVADLPLAYLCVDAGEPEKLRTIEVPANPKVAPKLIERGRRFWQDHVLAGHPPEPNGSERDGGIVVSLYPRSTPGETVTLGDDANELLSDYLAHRFKEREHSDAAEAAKQRLCLLMGEAESAVVGSWRLSYKTQSRTSLDTKGIRAAHPDICAEFMRTSESRVFGQPKENK